jgi:SET domain-containing protein
MEILSIKEMMDNIGFDPELFVKLEYKKCQHHLKQLIKRTETTLISIEKSDGMEVLSERQKSVQLTLNQLILVHNKMVEMEGIIYALKEQNELLTERLNLRK